MSAIKPAAITTETVWTPQLVKMLRGKRTLAEFGELIGAPKNTVWRWEAGRAKPDAEYSAKMTELAQTEGFLEDWELAGSIEIASDIELEQVSARVAERFRKSIARTVAQIAGREEF